MSHVSRGRHGQRGEGKTILDAQGISAMFNDDGSVILEAYSAEGDAVRFTISHEDALSQSHVFASWSRLRAAFKPEQKGPLL